MARGIPALGHYGPLCSLWHPSLILRLASFVLVGRVLIALQFSVSICYIHVSNNPRTPEKASPRLIVSHIDLPSMNGMRHEFFSVFFHTSYTTASPIHRMCTFLRVPEDLSRSVSSLNLPKILFRILWRAPSYFLASLPAPIFWLVATETSLKVPIRIQHERCNPNHPSNRVTYQ